MVFCDKVFDSVMVEKWRQMFFGRTMQMRNVPRGPVWYQRLASNNRKGQWDSLLGLGWLTMVEYIEG